MSAGSSSERVLAFAARAGFVASRVENLAGDASTRRYFRVFRDGGASRVVMDCGLALPEPEPGAPEPFAFLRWREFYAGLELRVPEVESVDRAQGLVLLEDLGDELLQRRVETRGAVECASLYRVALDIGRRLALHGTPRFVPDAAASDDPLTPRRLAREMDFFLQHAVGVTPAALEGATGALRDARLLLDRLCLDVHAPPGHPRADRVALCHRDYHARNLLVVPGRAGRPDLAVIDFQDTRRGPRAYDLASLAWDPYVTLPPSLIEELVEAWRPDDGTTPRDWHEEVRLAAGQRLLKAAGTYAYMSRERGRGEYLQWFGPAVSRAVERLARWPHLPDLRKALSELGLPL